MRGLLLVAHPDDEVLFAGSLLLSTPEVEWAVICATYDTQHERGLKFQGSMVEFINRGARITESYMLGLADTGPVLTMSQYNHWAATVFDILDDLPRYDLVVTHGRMGEYGHGHHMALHQIARLRYGGDFWSFVCEAPSAIGPQQRHTFGFRYASGTDKFDIMQTVYGEEAKGMSLHHPEVLTAQFYAGGEYFTSDAGPWPL